MQLSLHQGWYTKKGRELASKFAAHSLIGSFVSVWLTIRELGVKSTLNTYWELCGQVTEIICEVTDNLNTREDF